MSVYPAATASVDVDGGDVSSADMPEDVDAVGGQSLKLDFSQLSGGLIPMELSVEEPGHVFKAVIGL